MKSLYSTLLLSLAACCGMAQTPTWAADVAPILYEHCVSCHRAGGIGHFPLETYTDAVDASLTIVPAITSRYMPPYRANPEYRHFREENYLTDAEIQAITDWANGGTPAGDFSQAPPLPNFQNGSQLSSVDMVLETPLFTIFDESDIYRAFAIPAGVATDQFFNEVEFMPGNDEIIHHIVVYTDPTNDPLLLDEADPGPGWSTNGMVGNLTPNATLVAEWTPGGTVIKMPPEFGYRIPAGGYFIVEIHFAPDHLGETDAGSLVNLRLTPTVPRELYYGVLTFAEPGFGLLNPPFLIPANTAHTLVSELQVSSVSSVPLSVFTLTPHAHVYGKSFKAFSYKPGGTPNDTIPLIDIPKWDFYWQGTYTLQMPVKLPLNYRTRAYVTYDNTADNPLNPNSPPVDVTWGEQTTDEMLYLFATVAAYQPGDENIVLDSSLLVSASPDMVANDDGFIIANPVTDVLDIRAAQPVQGMADLVIFDMNGRPQRQWRELNLSHSRTSIAGLAPGVYVLQIRQAGKVWGFKVLKL